MAVLTYVTLICRSVDGLAGFYIALFGLEEITASRSERYREMLTGGSKLGFARDDAYAALNLPQRPSEAPVNTVLSFNVGEPAQVDALTRAAVSAGARLAKPAQVTPFGQYQSALLDPEGNVFRITAAAPAAQADTSL